MELTPNYVGRFAPSPTGPLHFGSLVAALASYLDARHQQGVWLLRIEDLDPPREQADAPQTIINQLHQLGFRWDQKTTYQSDHHPRYQSCLDQLNEQGHLFLCTCSRKSFDLVYPGKCRGVVETQDTHATRIQVSDEVITFNDLIQGPQSFDLASEVGDFILRRKDGLFAYQLAVVVDDHDQAVTHVIRGSDLLDSTPRQIYLAKCLGFKPPQFGHIPVMSDLAGQKLSKQAHAKPIDLSESASALKMGLTILNQPVIDATEPEQILAYAIHHWNRSRIPNQLSILSPTL